MEPQDTPTSERLSRVAPRITCVVLCWRNETISAATDVTAPPYPEAILGPFTPVQAERLAASLTCAAQIFFVVSEPPDWATA